MPYDATLLDSLNREIELTDPYIRLKEIDGWGMPAVRHIEEQYAQQDGVTYIETRLDKRIVTMRFDLWAATEAAMWESRAAFLRLLRVFAAGFKLRLDLPNGAARQIDLRYDAQFTLSRPWDENHKMQAAVLQCVAHSPTFYDPTPVLWAFAVSGGAGGWGWPLGFPAGWGASSAAGTPETKQYTGTWKAYPLITLTGPMTEPVITNHTTGHKLEFIPGYVIEDGESVVIDLTMDSRARRALTVTHSIDGNVPDALTDDSHLGSFHIAADPEAIDGNNSISVAFTGGNAGSRAEIRFYTRYIGV